MHFYPEEKIAVFIDGANLYATTKAIDIHIDFKKLSSFFAEQGQLIRMSYYTAIFDDTEYSSIRPMIDWLDYNGYTVVTKPVREFTDSSGNTRIKGNMDVELVVDALEAAKYADHIVLFSGDGDFCALIEALQRKGKRVSIVSSMKTQMISDALRRQADFLIDLVDIREQIERKS